MFFKGGWRISVTVAALVLTLFSVGIMALPPFGTMDAQLINYWHTPQYPDIDDAVTIWLNTTETNSTSFNATVWYVSSTGKTEWTNRPMIYDNGTFRITLPNPSIPLEEGYVLYRVSLKNETGEVWIDWPQDGSWLNDNITWDGTVPDTNISSSPNNIYGGIVYVNNNSIFTLTANDPDSDGPGDNYIPSGVNLTEYDINGSGWTAYTVPFSLQGNPDGAYTISSYSIDNADNNETAESYDVVFDSVAPTIMMESPNATIYTVQNIDFNVTLNEAGYNCSYELNGSAGVDMTNESATRFTASQTVADGNYTVIFYCQDLALNTGTAAVSFQVDATPPVLSILSPENRSYSTTALELNYSAFDENGDLDAVWYENATGDNVTINGSVGAGSLSGTEPITALDNTQSVITLWANDTAGNTNSTSVVFSVDSENPVAVPGSPEPFFNSSSAVVSFELMCTDNIETGELQIQGNDSGTWEILGNTTAVNGTYWTFTGTFTEGEHWWRAWCNDSVGNSDTSSPRMFTVDLTVPIVSVTGPADGGEYSTPTLELNYSASDERTLDSVWYEYNGTNTSLSGNITFPALDNQVSTLTVWANDTAGNTGMDSVIFLVDTINPLVSSVWSGGAPSILINVSHSDANPGYAVVNFDGTNHTSNWSTSNLTQFSISVATPEQGQCHHHSYYAYVNDTVGNHNQTDIINITVCTPNPPGPGSGSMGWSGGGGGGSSLECHENWTCSEWSAECTDGMYTRTCTDANQCGTEDEKPSETIGCAPPAKQEASAAVVCNSGERVCAGNNVQECSQDGKDWIFVETCDFGCYGGECEPEPPAEVGAVTGLISGSTAAIAGAVVAALAIAGGIGWYLNKKRKAALMNEEQ